jgi:Zn-dependent M16 (insulinase) family peptidase
LHQLEVGQKHKTTTFGMSVFQAVVGSWLHGAPPIDQLRLNEHVARLRADLDGGQLFARLVQRHLLDNPHRVRLTAQPDNAYAANETAAERALLDKRRATLNDDDIVRLRDEALLLAQRQAEVPDLTCLPTLTRDDIATPTPFTKPDRQLLSHASQSNVELELFTTAQPTGGMHYTSLLFAPRRPLPLPARLVPLVPLFCSALTQLGTATRTHRQLALDIESVCGELHASPVVQRAPSRGTPDREGIALGWSSLARNATSSTAIVADLLHAVRWQQPELLRVRVAGMVESARDGIADSGHAYARRLAASSLSRRGALSEQWQVCRHSFRWLCLLLDLKSKSINRVCHKSLLW